MGAGCAKKIEVKRQFYLKKMPEKMRTIAFRAELLWTFQQTNPKTSLENEVILPCLMD